MLPNSNNNNCHNFLNANFRILHLSGCRSVTNLLEYRCRYLFSNPRGFFKRFHLESYFLSCVIIYFSFNLTASMTPTVSHDLLLYINPYRLFVFVLISKKPPVPIFSKVFRQYNFCCNKYALFFYLYKFIHLE